MTLNDRIALNLLHAGYPIRIDTAGELQVQVLFCWKHIPDSSADIALEREALQKAIGCAVGDAFAEGYNNALTIAEACCKATERVRTVVQTHGGAL